MSAAAIALGSRTTASKSACALVALGSRTTASKSACALVALGTSLSAGGSDGGFVAPISLNSKFPFGSNLFAAVRAAQPLDAESQLIGRCLGGEQHAWEELLQLHTKRVYSICYRFTNSESEAQDLTQDVFLRIFRTLGSFRSGEGSFTVWLTRLTRNLLVDHYRRTKHDRMTDGIEEKLAVLEEKTAQHGRTDGLLASREAAEVLQAALQKLSPELREAVILRDLNHMEYREIARSLEVPEGTVKSRLNRGRAELARVLRRNKVTV